MARARRGVGSVFCASASAARDRLLEIFQSQRELVGIEVFRAPAKSEAACWSHSRRKFFELADLRKAPLASDAVHRIDAIFAIERDNNGATAEQPLAVRQERVKPLVDELEA